MKKREIKRPGFPGRFLFFLWGGCEFVFEALLLFVVVEVFEFGLWCLSAAAAAASSPVFSVEKLQLSQLVMFEFDIDPLLFLPKLVLLFTLLLAKGKWEQNRRKKMKVYGQNPRNSPSYDVEISTTQPAYILGFPLQ